jgi:hypothetical protein
VEYRYIELTNGGKAKVDANDYHWLSDYSWKLVSGYAMTEVDGKWIGMHRMIMSVNNSSLLVDHEDHDTLDNTRENLRVVTKSQNMMNSRKKANCTSKYKGVRYRKDTNTYQVRIHKDKRVTLAGNFTDEIAGANAYNHYAKELHGEFAYLNDVPYMDIDEVNKYKINGRRKKVK